MKIKIKYCDTELNKVRKIPVGEWVDLRASENVTIKRDEYKLISLGVSMKLPSGYEAHIAPRSSTYKNWGVIQANGIGIIDNTYCGNDDIWKFPAICIGRDETSINKGDRICQFRIVKTQPKITFVEVDNLKGENRGGFGSTGKK